MTFACIQIIVGKHVNSCHCKKKWVSNKFNYCKCALYSGTINPFFNFLVTFLYAFGISDSKHVIKLKLVLWHMMAVGEVVTLLMWISLTRNQLQCLQKWRMTFANKITCREGLFVNVWKRQFHQSLAHFGELKYLVYCLTIF